MWVASSTFVYKHYLWLFIHINIYIQRDVFGFPRSRRASQPQPQPTASSLSQSSLRRAARLTCECCSLSPLFSRDSPGSVPFKHTVSPALLTAAVFVAAPCNRLDRMHYLAANNNRNTYTHTHTFIIILMRIGREKYRETAHGPWPIPSAHESSCSRRRCGRRLWVGRCRAFSDFPLRSVALFWPELWTRADPVVRANRLPPSHSGRGPPDRIHSLCPSPRFRIDREPKVYQYSVLLLKVLFWIENNDLGSPINRNQLSSRSINYPCVLVCLCGVCSIR